MNKIETRKAEVTMSDGTKARLFYDEDTDIMEIVFGKNEAATGVELNDYMILRADRQARRAVSLTLLHFSILAELTEYGPRSYPLDKLEEAPDDLHELALRLVNSEPVNQFLKMSHFQASATKKVPFTYVESRPILRAA